MIFWCRAGTVALLVGFACLTVGNLFGSKQEKGNKDSEKGTPVSFTFTAFDRPEPFYQILTTKTVQKMTIMGQPVDQKQDQTFYLKWTPLSKKDGNWRVKQQIIGVKMTIDIGGVKIDHDTTKTNQAKNPMVDFFHALTKHELTLTITPKMDIVCLEGREQLLKPLAATNPQMSKLLNSILSEDGLKQMAEPAWAALPLQPVHHGDSWKRASKLNLGPIGKYYPTNIYTFEGIEKNQARIKIQPSLTYEAPKEKEGLPFLIKKAELTSKEGSGEAIFNMKKGWFDSSKVSMKLQGKLTIEVGGMDTEVALDQNQTATITTLDRNPLEKKSETKGEKK